MSSRASIAARVAAVVGASGYIGGVVDGSVLGLLGCLAVLSFGRALAADRGNELLAPASFAILAGAAGVVALRWGTLELDDIGGIHAVLGPIVAVQPVSVAGMAAASMVAALMAAGVGMTDPGPSSAAPGWWWWWVEVATLAGALALLFGSAPSTGLAGTALWLGATVALTAMIAVISRAGISRPASARALTVGICGAVVAAAALVIGVVS